MFDYFWTIHMCSMHPSVISNHQKKKKKKKKKREREREKITKWCIGAFLYQICEKCKISTITFENVEDRSFVVSAKEWFSFGIRKIIKW